MGLDTAFSVNFDANGRAEGSQGGAQVTLHNCQRPVNGPEGLGVSLCPDQGRRNASRGQGSEPCKTIDHSAGNTAGRSGRRVHRCEKLPGRAVLWASRLLRSYHPPKRRARFRQRKRDLAADNMSLAGPCAAHQRFASVVHKAGVVQWQYRSFPSFGRGFDSHRPLHKS
jgi:hypothetical protein